jgi:serine/threonine-protein kinase
MEYLDGQDLLAIVSREWPLAAPRIVSLLSQTLAALAVAHDLGIVHRDLKPENVMVQRSRDDEGDETETVKVCDFGVAKLLPDRRGDDGQGGTQTGTLTATGVLVGTPEYMSPEQVCGEELDARSDLYSLGVILYQMLTRHLPFEDKSPIKLAMMQVQQKPKPPSQLVPGIDARLEAICLKALSKRPDDRYASAREMRSDLRGLGGARDSAVMSVRESPRQSPPPVSARVVPQGNEVKADEHAALSAAPTLLAALTQEPTVTQPSAAQLEARKRNRWIALGAIVVAVLVLLALAK